MKLQQQNKTKWLMPQRQNNNSCIVHCKKKTSASCAQNVAAVFFLRCKKKWAYRLDVWCTQSRFNCPQPRFHWSALFAAQKQSAGIPRFVLQLSAVLLFQQLSEFNHFWHSSSKAFTFPSLRIRALHPTHQQSGTHSRNPTSDSAHSTSILALFLGAIASVN